MGIIDRIKRRLPILGAPPPSAPQGATARPYEPPAEPEEPKSPRGSHSAPEFIRLTVEKNPVVLFMKGNPQAPQCGFSATAAGILSSYNRPYATVNVLADEEIRDGVKSFTNWPTIPQVFIGGEFVGGSDILRQLHDSGELKAMLDAAAARPAPTAS